MLNQDVFVKIQVLNHQGKSIKGIAREIGVSRNTVRKYLRKSNELPTYKKREPRTTKLSAYESYLKKRVEQAKPEWIPAIVLYREIQEQGYNGKLTQLRRFLAPLKEKRQEDPLVRFETPAGKQMQVDFTIIYRGNQPLKALVASLGYSRASYVYFYDNERSESWLDGIQRAFDFFGGVPKEILFDNAKSIILERDAYGEGNHRWHPKLLELSKKYGFVPKVCRPYRPRTKGKVERFNRYLKENFVTPLAATFRAQGLQLDVASANGAVGAWLNNIANERIHATTLVKPNVRLIEEKQHLLPLPPSENTTEATLPTNNNHPMPVESIQHPLGIYDQFMAGSFV